MNPNSQLPDDAKLHALLSESRPLAELPPGFQDAVWRRIDRAERPAPALPAADWIDSLAAWLLRPRRAFAMASAILLLGLSLGIARGASQAGDLAKARYLNSVSPPALRQ